ncbi:MAG: EutN/CcmL family microcompartment protein [Elusimicrobiota bacterium]
MIIGKVIGNVWATRKHSALTGKKLLLVKPVDEISGEPNGETQMAVDQSIDAGPGDTVLVLDEGSSCRQILGYEQAPTRTIVVGVVDNVYREGKFKKYH